MTFDSFLWVNVFSFLMGLHVKLVELDTCIDATDICLNYKINSHNLLETQVNLELQASYFYQIYGAFFDRSEVALPGFSEYFLRESLHEHNHADNFLRYINQRGGRPTFQDIKIGDICTNVKNTIFCQHVLFNHESDILNSTIKKVGLWAMEDALRFEQNVMRQLDKIITTDDHQINHYIEHEYLDEQIQTIKRLGSFVGQLNKFSDQEYFLGQYNFDNNLYKKVKKTQELNEKYRKRGKLNSHYQWNDERDQYDSLYI